MEDVGLIIDQGLIDQVSPRDIGDLAAFVPNFSASTITNFNAASFAMRGVGQTSIIVYFEPPVAVLVGAVILTFRLRPGVQRSADSVASATRPKLISCTASISRIAKTEMVR